VVQADIKMHEMDSYRTIFKKILRDYVDYSELGPNTVYRNTTESSRLS